jgi:hypothetical protein
VVIEHVDPGTPRRTTGQWSDWNDPLAIEAQVDYGENSEGGGSGETRTVRVDARTMEGISRRDRAWLRCRRPAFENGGCEQD